MFKRLKHMLIKEFLQLLRDPRMRITIFAMPVVQMTIFAFALTTDVTNIQTAVLDSDNTPASRSLVADFTASGYFEVVEYAASQAQLAEILDHSRARAVLHIPAGYMDALDRGGASVQLLADGTDSNTTAIVFGYTQQVVMEHSRKLLAEAAAFQGRQAPAPVSFELRAWFNPNLESKLYFVPGLIGVMLLVITTILTSVAIVREKEAGTIEQVMVTPITSLEFILGKTVPFVIIGYILMTLMLGIAMLVFGIRIAGDPLLLYALTGIYILGNLGMALIISVASSTQQQAVLTAFLFIMPCVLLSGFMFPVDNMPEVVQYATYLNPMRYYIDILRGVVIKGAGVAELWPAILGQSVLAVGFMLTAVARFKKTLA
jgi:ABC-2 type transport system permease protein